MPNRIQALPDSSPPSLLEYLYDTRTSLSGDNLFPRGQSPRGCDIGIICYHTNQTNRDGGKGQKASKSYPQTLSPLPDFTHQVQYSSGVLD